MRQHRLATRGFGDDRLGKAVAAGECQIAVTNSYYLARLMRPGNPDDRAVAEKVGVVTSYISMMESGQKFPNLEMFFALATALEIRASALILAMEAHHTNDHQ